METLVKLLAVVGGAALGAAVVGFVVRFAGKRMGASTAPKRLLFVVRTLGAIAAGWVVWLFVFGPGGAGIGGPGGLGRGGSEGTGKGTGKDVAPATQPSPSNLAAERGKTLPVVMLGGGRVQDGRFYQVVGEKEAHTLGELKDLIRKRQTEGVRGIEILIYENSVAKDHTAVTSLQEWAGQHDLSVTLSFPTGEAP